jgi:hypothetical protein
MLDWRPVVAGDLSESLNICPESAGQELIAPERTLAAWHQLFTTRSFAGAVVEPDIPTDAHRIAAVGAAVFVTRTFAEQETASPQPGLNARIIASIDAGRSVALSDSQLRLANASGGLDLVILCAGWRKSVVDSGRLPEVESLLSAAFFRLFAGWRFHRMIREGIGREQIAHIDSQGIFGSKYSFGRFLRLNPGSRWKGDRALFVANKEHAMAIPGSVASILFGYHEPVLRLRDCDQELLTAALTGATDGELARTLHLKLPTVKKRWAAVFSRVTAVQPDLLPSHEAYSNDHARGPQKRHRLLEFLRNHPQELRPVLPAGTAGVGRHTVRRKQARAEA